MGLFRLGIKRIAWILFKKSKLLDAKFLFTTEFKNDSDLNNSLKGIANKLIELIKLQRYIQAEA